MTHIIRFLYLPIFLLLGNGLAIFIVSEGLPKLWLGAVLAGFIVLSFMTEKLAPYDRAFNKTQNDSARDFIHAVVNELLSVSGLLFLPLLGSSLALLPVWPSDLPIAAQLIIAILIADIGITLAHYASHQLQLLWKLHAVHHSVKRMYGFNGLMKHPLHQLIETVAGTTPLLIMGIPQDILALLVIAVALQLLLQHSNVAYYSGPLKKVLAINSVHRFHHLNTPEEGDVNFGLFTTLTDRLIGTAYYIPDKTFDTQNLGIAAEPDYPNGYIDQLLHPFGLTKKSS